MSRKNEMYRALLGKPTVTLAANIFDPLSARIAQIVGYDLLVLSGSVGKAANLAAPDIVVSTLPDVQDHIRRITRSTDIPIMVDAEDGFGNAVNVWRCVRELEAAGVSGIEIEDNVVPKQFGVQNPGLNAAANQVGKLQAAVAARTDPTTVIIARTATWGIDREHAIDRIKAYAATGAEAFMLTGVKSKADIEATHKAAPNIPITVLAPPVAIRDLSEVVIGRDGLVIERGFARGLLLPQVAERRGWDPEAFAAETCRKAGLPKDAWREEGTVVRRFEAVCFEEEE